MFLITKYFNTKYKIRNLKYDNDLIKIIFFSGVLEKLKLKKLFKTPFNNKYKKKIIINKSVDVNFVLKISSLKRYKANNIINSVFKLSIKLPAI